MNQRKPDLEKISKMHPLEKVLIALRGGFQYADKHNTHVDNKKSIEQITSGLNAYYEAITIIGDPLSDEQKKALRSEWLKLMGIKK